MADDDRAKFGPDSVEPLIRLSGVNKHFGDVHAVRDLDLDIESGRFLAIMGPSGCGKTTTLRLIAGLENPTTGSIRYRGRDVSGGEPWDRGMPLVWQDLALFPFLDVIGNVAFGLKMARVGRRERRERSQKWLDRLGIGELAERDISVLSGGQLQRVALARALVTEPDILLLDEPLSALDAALVVRMQAELTRLQRDLGITFVYVTHNQSEAFAMADRVIIMDDGRIQQAGEARDVYAHPENRFVAEFVGTNNVLPASVEKVDGSRSKLRTALGTFVSDSQRNREFRAGDDAYLVISADRVGLGAAPAEGEVNKLTGRMVTEQFVGAVVTVYIDAGKGPNLLAQIQQREWDRIDAAPDRDLSTWWRPEDCFPVRD